MIYPRDFWGKWPFGDGMRPFDYDLLMADPAWLFELWSEKGEGKSAQAHYKCIDLETLKALPVGHLAAKDCLLFLWATHPMLPQALEVMEAWGFTFKTSGVWVKRTRKRGLLGFGPGYILRSASEPFLIGTVGNPQVTKSSRTVIEGVLRSHSEKPAEAYAFAEKMMPKAKRADLFSRRNLTGWDSWGDEAGKFNAAESEAA